jgi:hypothetical protein
MRVIGLHQPVRRYLSVLQIPAEGIDGMAAYLGGLSDVNEEAHAYGGGRRGHRLVKVMTQPDAHDYGLSLGKGNLTPGITRRAAPRRNLTSSVSAVGCMPMLDAA